MKIPLGRTEEGLLNRREIERPPTPPPDRYYINWRLVKRVSELRTTLNQKTLSGDLLRLEIAWRGFKRSVFIQVKPILKPILDYLK